MQEEKKYCVYKHTAPNGKIYIGLTSLNPLKRWKNGKGYRYNTHFDNAITKYGWDNFTHEILFTDLTKSEAEQKEIELIKLYKSNQQEYGYNIESGGNSQGKMSDETKRKIREYQKTVIHSPLKTETKAKISQNRKGKCTGDNHPMFQKQLSDKTKQKISSSLKGRKIPEEALKKRIQSQTGLKRSIEIVERQKQNSRARAKNIMQYSKDGAFIKEWTCIIEIEETLNIANQNISKCCKGERKTAGGFVWRYKEGVNNEALCNL